MNQVTDTIPVPQENRWKLTIAVAAGVLTVICLVVAPNYLSPAGATLRSLNTPSSELVPFTSLTCQVHLTHESFQDGSSDVSLSCNVPDSAFHESAPSLFYTLDLPSKSFCREIPSDSTFSSSANKCGLTNRIFEEIQRAHEESSSDSDTVVELTIPHGQANMAANTLHIIDHSAAVLSNRKVVKVFPMSFSPADATTPLGRNGDTNATAFLEGEGGHRRLAPSFGSLRVAVFRISAWDSVPTFSRATQYANIFTGAGSLANQLSLCSNYQVALTPCAPKAMEITVPMNARGADRLTVVNAAYPLAVARIRASEPRLYGWLARLEDYADILIFMVVSQITSCRSGKLSDKWMWYRY
jgi:hypothetical protein